MLRTTKGVEVLSDIGLFDDPGFIAAVQARGINDPRHVIENPLLMRQRPERDAQLMQLDSLPDNTWEAIDQMVVTEGPRSMPTVMSLMRAPVDNPFSSTFKTHTLAEFGPAQETHDPESVNVSEFNDYEPIRRPVPYVVQVSKYDVNQEGSWSTYRMENTSEAMERVMFLREQQCYQGVVSLSDVHGNTLEGPGLDARDDITRTPAGTNGKWNDGAKTGTDYLDDSLGALGRFANDRQSNGPVALFVTPQVYAAMGKDHVGDAGTVSVRGRLMGDVANFIAPTHGISTPTSAYFVNLGSRTVRYADYMAPMVLTWVSPMGMKRYVCVLSKGAPVIVPTAAGRVGVQVIT